MLPEFTTEPRESPWQPKLCKNKPKFRRIQFGIKAMETMFACMVGFPLSENSNANKNFRGAKGVAIATKFTQKKPKMYVI